MESGRRGKRKSPSQDIIFEVSDNDMSSNESASECDEPEAKILKMDGNNFQLRLNEDSNLEDDKQINVEDSGKEDESQDNSVEITEYITVSNHSSSENSANTIDVVVINEEAVNVDEEEDVDPTGISAENSIIDITEDNTNSLKDEEEGKLEDGEVLELQSQVMDEVDGGCTSYIEIDKEFLEELDVVTTSPCVEVQSITEDNSKPCICITFKDEKVAELYKSKFLKFIQSFVELEVNNYEGLTINIQRDSFLDPNEWVVCDETMCKSEVKECEEEQPSELPATPTKLTKKKKKKKTKKEKDLFILDTNPSQTETTGPCTKYCTKFQIESSEKNPAEEIEVKMSSQSCFNCDNNHSLKDCPLPKDFAKINAARQRFKTLKLTSRYHLDDDQKYSHLAPGRLSDRLRDALGLRKNQLPPYIYQMRLMGYPPGWLQEAKFVHSNLTMFDSEGNDVRDVTKKKQGLDPEKIIDYPGFNVPLLKDTKDEYRKHRVPPFSDNFSKRAMMEFFDKQCAKEQDNFVACDMDLDSSFDENKPKSVVKIGEMVLVNPQITELKETDSNMPSPSLTDLEKQKENLLAALEDNSCSNPKFVEALCEEQEKSNDASATKLPVNQNLQIVIDEKAEDSSVSYISPPLNTSINSVKTSTFGTPILKSNSPYSHLPNPDNFMKDVSPVINFENLPNSTGKYEQMTGVLQKVRSTLKNLQNCKS